MSVVPSISNRIPDKSLMELAKIRVETRGNPITANYSSYSHWRNVRTSCWIVEQVGREFYCDCPIGMTGKLCKHSMALCYSKLDYPVLDTLCPKKFTNKRRKPGRPAKVGPALSLDPPRNIAENTEYVETGEE